MKPLLKDRHIKIHCLCGQKCHSNKAKPCKVHLPGNFCRPVKKVIHSLSSHDVSYMSNVISGATKLDSNSTKLVSVKDNLDLVLKAIVSVSFWK